MKRLLILPATLTLLLSQAIASETYERVDLTCSWILDLKNPVTVQMYLENTPTWNLPNGCKWDFTATDTQLTKIETCKDFVSGQDKRQVWKVNRKMLCACLKKK